MLASLRDRALRFRVYQGVGLFIFLVALATSPLKEHFDYINRDGRWYYVYLPSLVVDGDLDFSNQIREHWYTDWHPPLDQVGTIWHTETGLLKNKFPIGPALTLAPSFLTAHLLALLLHALTGASWCVPDGYTVPYQVINLLFMLGLTAWSMRLTDELLTEEFGANPALVAAAVILYWLGTPMLYYSFREPYMSHVVGAFWVTTSIYLCWRLQRTVTEAGRLSLVRLTLLAFTTSMALICRPTNVFLLPFHLWLLAGILRSGLGLRFLLSLPVALLGLVPFGVQLLIWRGLYGRWFHYAYEQEGFRWTHPAGWQTLFSSRHGLFFWSPLLLASLAGLLWFRRQGKQGRTTLLVCFATSFLMLWYFNSAWWCWYFGDAFGGRAFLELGSLFVIGLAGAFEAVRRAGTVTRRAFVTAVCLALVYHGVLFYLYSFRLIPRSDYLF
jgi:hypothetical protein